MCKSGRHFTLVVTFVKSPSPALLDKKKKILFEDFGRKQIKRRN
jgi:hypothetical protein